MNAIDAFATEVRAYLRWLIEGSDTGHDSAREGLLRLTRLYAAGLELPEQVFVDTNEVAGPSEIEPTEWKRAVQAAARLPFDYYGEVFDPKVLPPEEAVVASLSDDLADIYRDVANGLIAYDASNTADAAWQWRFGLYSHWGRHATGAIRALHCWLAEHIDDDL